MSSNPPPYNPRQNEPTRPLDAPRPGEAARPMPQPGPRPLEPGAIPQAAHAEARRSSRPVAETGSSSVFWPVLIFFAAWLAWAAFQALQLHEESKSLQSLKGNQEQQVQQAQRVRQTLDALASETKKLADAGNPNAKTVIDELAKRGITVNPPSQPAPAPAK